MNNVQSLSDTRFLFNGIPYLKNYLSRVAGNKVIIFNGYENNDILCDFTDFSEFTVNGQSFSSASELQEALLSVIYARTTLGVIDNPFKGTITLASAAPSQYGIYQPQESGTYPNYGGLSVDLTQGMVQIVYNESGFSKILYPLNLSAYTPVTDFNVTKGKVETITEIAYANLAVASTTNGYITITPVGSTTTSGWKRTSTNAVASMYPIVAGNAYYYTGVIDASASGNAAGIAFFNSSGVRIGTAITSAATYNHQVITIPSGAAYMAACSFGGDALISTGSLKLKANLLNQELVPVTTFNPVSAKVSEIYSTSLNLLNKATVIDGTYYKAGLPNDLPGGINNGAGWKRTPLIAVLPNTQYTISGIATIYIGNQFGADGLTSQGAINPDSTSTIKTTWTFVTGANTYFLGININSVAGQDNKNTAMLALGTNTTYAPFGGGVDWGKVQNIPEAITAKSDVFYTLSLNGSPTGNELFTVYVQMSKDSLYYVGYKIGHFVDAAIRADLWRICGADLFKLQQGAMAPQNINLITAQESEAVFSQVGKSDFSGGYHGDEILTSVQFFANGVPLAINAAIGLTAGREFSYIQKSNILETDNATNTNICYAEKRTTLRLGGYKTAIRWKFLAAFNIQTAYCGGIVCINTPQAASGFTENYNTVVFNQDGQLKFNEPAAREVNYFHQANGLGARVTAKINKPVAYDSEALMCVWDQPNYAKYYRQLKNKPVVVNEVWEGETEVTHFKI